MNKSFVTLFEEYARPYNIPPVFLRWTAISLLAGLVQRKIMFKAGGRGLYLNLFVLLVGEPGSAKTGAMRVGLEVLDELSKQVDVMSQGLNFNYKLTQATPAAMILKLCRNEQTLALSNNRFIIQSPLYVYAEEAGTFLKDIGGGDSIQELLHLFDCPDFFNKETRNYGSEYVKCPYLNLLCGTTQDYFHRFMNSEAAAQGLSARFIFPVVSAQEETKYNYEASPDSSVFQAMITQAKRVALTKGTITDHPSCRELTEGLSNQFYEAKKNSFSGMYIKHYLARKFLMVRKVAALLAIAEDSTLIIQPEHYIKANQYLTELEANFMNIFRVRVLDNKETLAAIDEVARNLGASGLNVAQIRGELYARGMISMTPDHSLSDHVRTLTKSGQFEIVKINGVEKLIKV